VLCLNPNHRMPPTLSRPYMQQLLKKKPWQHRFGNDQLYSPLVIVTGRTVPGEMEVWTLMIECLEIMELDIKERILGFLPIRKNLVTVKVIISQENN